MGKHISLSVDQKHIIFEKKLKDPNITHSKLAQEAMIEFNLTKLPDVSTISKILKRFNESPINQNEIKGRKRVRMGKWPLLEETLLTWINRAEHNNIPITWDSIKAKAMFYAETLGYEDFKGSKGWLQKFKTRHLLKMSRFHDETASDYVADNTSVKEEEERYGLSNDCDLEETTVSHSKTTTVLQQPNENSKYLTAGLLFKADKTKKWFKTVMN